MTQPDGKSFSVLFVEKDSDICHFVQRCLEHSRQFPTTVDLAAGIEEAWNKLNHRSYDLVLAESELEEEQGMSLWQRMQENQIELPFVLMLPIHDEEIVRRAIQAGIADLLIKNQSHYQELSEKLRKSFVKFQENHRRLNGKHVRRNLESLNSPLPKVFDDKKEIVVRDELTGLYSHGYLHERIVGEFSRAARYGYPLACIILDIDLFKTINEDYGYSAGEAVLREAGELLFENCRISDFIARFGGEEFCVILPHTNYQGAMELAVRLKSLFAGHRFLADTHGIHLTISAGVSAYPEDLMMLRGDLIHYASQALQHSKESGRNTVTAYRDFMPFSNGQTPSLKIRDAAVQEFQRKMAKISEASRTAYLEVSKALIHALEVKDKFTAGHGASTAKYCLQIAAALGLDHEDAEVIRNAGLLHDIGKICVPDEVLLKAGRLTLSEFETIKQHPNLGYQLLKPIKFLQQEAIMVLHHHEWFNGEGYPCRLKGEEIPLGSRIIAVADSYDTMRHAGGRYKKTNTVADSVNELIACSGTQFDPQVVRAFIDVLEKRREIKEGDFNRARLEEILKRNPS